MTADAHDRSTHDDDALRLRQDIATRHAVQQRLDACSSADLTRVGVGVEGGVVTLVGTVTDERARATAVDVARAVPGVTRVIDLLLLADEHAAVAQTRAADASSRQGSSRGASPQETGLVPSSEDPVGPWRPADDEAPR
jgi:hypothetical protein